MFYTKPDGGKNSGVTGYFLIEWKKLFSVGLLRFNEGSREAYHSHAFNALTWWLSGKVTEQKLNVINEKEYSPSIIPKYTTRDNFHRVKAHKKTFALTFRGPWSDTWKESRQGKMVTLTHGRIEL